MLFRIIEHTPFAASYAIFGSSYNPALRILIVSIPMVCSLSNEPSHASRNIVMAASLTWLFGSFIAWAMNYGASGH